MQVRVRWCLTATLLTCLLGACGSSAPADISTPVLPAAAIPLAGRTASARLLDWPEFGLDPQRSDVSELATGITQANVAHLKRRHLLLPGTVDSSPIYLHEVSVAGSLHDVIVLTTTYGKTLAIDGSSDRTLWTFTPPGYSHWAGSAQITVASPLVDPDRLWVYTASPDGLIHKLAVANGRQDTADGWPVRVTREPAHEKLGAALNVDGPDILVATSGYIGDAPPYQGHVVAIDRSSGRITAVYNTLCSNRRELLLPSSCPASDSAILSRGGPVVEPGGGHILIDTGNGPWNGSSDFGDSVLELTFPALDMSQAFTPVNQEELNSGDLDLGSSAPALLGENRVVAAGKDGILRLLELSKFNGRSTRSHEVLGGELQRLSIPAGGQLFTAPAVWRRNGHTTMFVADEQATAAYVMRHGRLYRAWENHTPGTSPVMAGGLLYVYEPAAGGIYVYRPGSGRAIAKLPGQAGHWNSPIVVDGHVIEPEGNANADELQGALDIFSVG